MRVVRPTYDKLNVVKLKDEADFKLNVVKLKDEADFKVWRTSLELSLDEHWMGLQDVLKKIRLMKLRCEPGDFEGLIQDVALRPVDARLEDWSHRTIGRYLYGVLYHFTAGTLQNLVEEEEKTKDGVEAYRKLCAHCDPLNLYTGANKLMKAITDMGHVRVSSIDDLLATLKETKKRIADYEERVCVLPGAKFHVGSIHADGAHGRGDFNAHAEGQLAARLGKDDKVGRSAQGHQEECHEEGRPAQAARIGRSRRRRRQAGDDPRGDCGSHR